MTATATETRNGLKVGDFVTIDDPKFPGLWEIVSFGPKNVTLKPKAAGRGLRAPAFMLTKADETSASAPTIGQPYQEVKRPDGLDIGSVVTFKYPLKGAPAGTVHYVVIKDNWDTVNVTVLGGNIGRPGGYWRSIPVSRLEVVDVKTLIG